MASGAALLSERLKTDSRVTLENSALQSVHSFYDVYGYRFSLEGDCPEALDGVLSDFEFFQRESVENPRRIRLIHAEPPFDSAPPREATVYTPRNVSFTDDGKTYLDYKGRALGVHDPVAHDFQVTSLDKDLLYEAAYLFLLAQIGEFLDSKRMHRFHALAASVNGKSVLVSLPMGGGKSTLAAELLKDPDIKLLSDDSPFLGADGRSYAFPLHIGLLPGGQEGRAKDDQLREINRMEFGPKFLVGYRHFAERVVPDADPGFVFFGSRNFSYDCKIEKMSTYEAYRGMAANCVVGIGLFQGMEFVFQRSKWALVEKAAIAWSRLRVSRQIIKRSGVYKLSLGRSHETNAKTLLNFVRART